ncbi:MAG: hypothetical protein R3A52_15820 [Polyangiales bacterium]
MSSGRHPGRLLLLGAALALASYGCSGGAEAIPSGISPDAWGFADISADATVDIDALTPQGDGATSPDAGLDDTGQRPDGPFSGCRSNEDCRGNEFGFFICEQSSGQCVECSPSNDTCPADQHCDPRTFRCVRGCRADEGCATPGEDGGVTVNPDLHCNPEAHTCVRCVTDEHCAAGERCVGNVCVMGCGAGSRCDDGQTCCAGGCVDTASNAAHCGACDNRCRVANGEGACAMGACAVGSCTGSYRDCDMSAANGCETDTTTDLNNCGGCGRICPAPANATATCSAGACGFTCNAGFADCDGDPTNGCEVELASSAMNCGACGRACVVAGAAAACSMGACTVGMCEDGLADCDMNPANGCEADLRSNPAHCGGCGMACPAFANATAVCAMGRCAPRCADGFGDCDGNAANGCEVDLGSTPEHCGACGMVCAIANGTATCAMGRCGVGACNAGWADCDGDPANGCETDTRSDGGNCGMCGRACMVAGGSSACVGGVCSVGACEAGRGDCDMNPANGCETNTAGDTMNCGACGRVCVIPHGTATCMMGRCGVGTCDPGYADCDGDPTNGCETDTRTSTVHCGGCGTRCSTVNGAPACVNGMCGVGRCNPGFADCDMNPANGCETVIETDPRNCGRCGNACPTPSGGAAVCSGGLCAVGSCPAGRADCDMNASNGCETDISTTTNCGVCGRACPAPPNASAVCLAGTCGLGACNAGWADCDGNPANGCEVNIRTTVTSCGACGRVCNLPNATATCAAGSCAVGSCNAGWADCDGDAANGCETNIAGDATNCGRCGTRCAAPTGGSAACAAGVCQAVCPGGQSNCSGVCRATGGGCTSAGSGGCAQTGTLVCSGTATTCSASPRTSGSCSSPAGGVCGAGGACACPSGQSNCSGTCRVLSSDVNHCGACGNACVAPVGGSVSCASGSCVQACPAGQSNCGGFCRPTGAGCTSAGTGGCAQSGSVVCAGTGTACSASPRTSGSCSSPSGGVCGAGGACACGAGLSNCGGACVNLSDDGNNCGACGRACGAGRACAAGVCVGTGALRFTLTWDRAGDMDLRVMPPCGTEVYYGRTAICGGVLDRDDITGTGPENIFWSTSPARGSYRVCPTPYNISGATNWTLRIFHGSTQVAVYTGTSSSSVGNRSCTSGGFLHSY